MGVVRKPKHPSKKMSDDLAKKEEERLLASISRRGRSTIAREKDAMLRRKRIEEKRAQLKKEQEEAAQRAADDLKRQREELERQKAAASGSGSSSSSAPVSSQPKSIDRGAIKSVFEKMREREAASNAERAKQESQIKSRGRQGSRREKTCRSLRTHCRQLGSLPLTFQLHLAPRI